MSIFRRKKQTDAETESLKSFLDMIAPSIVKFETGYYICGNTFRCVWALREYQHRPMTLPSCGIWAKSTA